MVRADDEELTDTHMDSKLLPQVHQKLCEGAHVADVGCGSAGALAAMASAYPESRFDGYEPDPTTAERASDRIRKDNLSARVRILNAPSGAMPERTYDFITTVEVIHEVGDPQRVIDDIGRALKSDGTYLMVEADVSHRLEDNLQKGKFLYSVSTMYCLPLSLAGEGAGIGLCMGEKLPREMCARAGQH